MDEAQNRCRILIWPSRLLIVSLAIAYAGALACLLSLGLSVALKTALIAFLIFSALCDLWTTLAGRGRRRVREIVLSAGGTCQVSDNAGDIHVGKPVAGRLVHPLAVCFTLALEDDRKLPVFILADMCDADAFRALRVWLRANGNHSLNPSASKGSLFSQHSGNRFRP